jgi:opacity protein-like surface antigen
MTRSLIKFLLLILFITPLAANSLTRGFYVGLQAGGANTNLPSLPKSDVIPDAVSTVRVLPGQTIKGSGGTTTNIRSASVTSIGVESFNTNINDKVYGGRIAIGYQVLDQLAFEFGFFHLRDQTTKYSSHSVVAVTGGATASGVTAVNPLYTAQFNQVNREDKYSENGIDLNVKAIAPLSEKINVYAKLGVAYMKVLERTTITLGNLSNLVVGTTPETGSISISSSDSSNTLTVYYPTLGAGVSYSISDSMEVDASWYRVVSRNNNTKNIDMFFVGINYSLGNWFLGSGD